MFRQLNIDKIGWNSSCEVDLYPVGNKVTKGEALFPRLDIEKELERLNIENSKLIAERTGVTLEEVLKKQAEN